MCMCVYTCVCLCVHVCVCMCVYVCVCVWYGMVNYAPSILLPIFLFLFLHVSFLFNCHILSYISRISFILQFSSFSVSFSSVFLPLFNVFLIFSFFPFFLITYSTSISNTLHHFLSFFLPSRINVHLFIFSPIFLVYFYGCGFQSIYPRFLIYINVLCWFIRNALWYEFFPPHSLYQNYFVCT